jgi:uncharacterized glyoxalase superfamily protein PhnB
MQAVQPALTTVQPSLQVEDVRRSVAFYVDKLGFRSRGVFEMDGEVVHAEVSGGSVDFMFGPKTASESHWSGALAGGST